MTTLGQRLSSNTAQQRHSLSPEQAKEREENRIKALVDSLTGTLERVRREITEAIETGAPDHRAKSKVLDEEPAYGLFMRLRYGRPLAYGPEAQPLQQVWDGFKNWAASEELRLRLDSHLPDIVDGVRSKHSYIVIAVEFGPGVSCDCGDSASRKQTFSFPAQ